MSPVIQELLGNSRWFNLFARALNYGLWKNKYSMTSLSVKKFQKSQKDSLKAKIREMYVDANNLYGLWLIISKLEKILLPK